MILGRRGELDVARRVERGLDRILNDADDEADADDLHRDVVRDAEQRARHRDEQQRAARHAGSAARAEGRHDREQNRRGQRDLHTQRIGRGQRHDGDGDGRAVHVDRRAEGDRDGVEVLVQAELFAHRHVHGDIRRGRAGEERRQAAFTQAAEHQRIGIAAQIDEDDDGVDDKCHEEHRADQKQQELAVLGEDRKAVAHNVREHKAHDAERCQIDDPAHDGGHRVRRVAEEDLRRVRTELLHRHAEETAPHQNADVVAVHNGGDGVRDDVGQQRVHDLAKALRDDLGLSGLGQQEHLREEHAGHNAQRRGDERRKHVEPHDRAEAAVELGRALRQRARHDDEHQHGGNALERADKQVAKLL